MATGSEEMSAGDIRAFQIEVYLPKMRAYH